MSPEQIPNRIGSAIRSGFTSIEALLSLRGTRMRYFIIIRSGSATCASVQRVRTVQHVRGVERICGMNCAPGM